MPVTKVGIVYYKDDPDKVFRVIYPQMDDSELEVPPTNGVGHPFLKDDGTCHSWTSFGTNPVREAVLEVIPAGSPRAVLTGSV